MENWAAYRQSRAERCEQFQDTDDDDTHVHNAVLPRPFPRSRFGYIHQSARPYNRLATRHAWPHWSDPPRTNQLPDRGSQRRGQKRDPRIYPHPRRSRIQNHCAIQSNYLQGWSRLECWCFYCRLWFRPRFVSYPTESNRVNEPWPFRYLSWTGKGTEEDNWVLFVQLKNQCVWPIQP